MQIELSVEEALEFAKFEARWDGFVMGARAAADEAKRMRLMEIRTGKEKKNVVPMAVKQPTPVPANSGEGEQATKQEAS